MPHRLDGSRLKLARAREHLHCLRLEIDDYLRTEPYTFDTAMQDVATARVSVRIKDEAPLHLSAVVGDCVQNLNAALDYIAWQLADKYWINKPRPGEKAARSVYFRKPGDLNKPAVDAATLRHAIAHIAALLTLDPRYEVLKDIANEDRHRVPVVNTALVTSQDLRVIRQIGDSFTLLARTTSPSLVLTTGCPNVFGEGEASVRVVLKMRGLEVIHQLEQLVDCVEGTIPQFHKFL
jgi:hypothetical protein